MFLESVYINNIKMVYEPNSHTETAIIFLIHKIRFEEAKIVAKRLIVKRKGY